MAESRYFFILSLDLKYIKENEYKELESLAEEISKMSHSLYEKIKSTN